MSKLIYAASPRSADMLHATGFQAPDAFVFLEHRGRKIVVLNDLEIDRGRRTEVVHDRLAAPRGLDQQNRTVNLLGDPQSKAVFGADLDLVRAVTDTEPAIPDVAIGDGGDIDAIGDRTGVDDRLLVGIVSYI